MRARRSRGTRRGRSRRWSRPPSSILAVFVPIAFMQGMVGRFFYEYGLTVSFAVAVSLLVALTLTPMLCAACCAGTADHTAGCTARPRARLRRARSALRALLAAALRHRMAGAGLALASVASAHPARAHDPARVLADASDRSEFEARLELPLGTGIERDEARDARAATRSAASRGAHGLLDGRCRQPARREPGRPLRAAPRGKHDRERDMLEVMDAGPRGDRRAPRPRRSASASARSPGSAAAASPATTCEYSIEGPDLAELESRRRGDRRAAAREPHLRRRPAAATRAGSPRCRPRWTAGAPRTSASRCARSRHAARAGRWRGRRDLPGGRRALRRARAARAEPTRRPCRARADPGARARRVAGRPRQRGPARGRIGAGADRARGPQRARCDVFANTPRAWRSVPPRERVDAIVAEVGLPPGYAGHHRGRPSACGTPPTR